MRMLSRNFRGPLYMIISMAGFTLNDGIIKSIDNEINLGQIMMIRGLVASLLLFWLGRIYGHSGVLQIFKHRLVLTRSLCELAASVGFLIALVHLPFANISAIMQALPLVVTLGAVVFFGESVGLHRWMAILIGLLGVLIIVRPGVEGFNGYTLLVLFVVLVAAMRDLLTRRLPSEIPSLSVSLVSSCLVTVVGGVLLLPMGGWQPVSVLLAIKLFASALLVIVGYQFIVLAMRTGDISIVAPFRYTSLLWAVGLGYFFFAEVPDPPTVLGGALVVLTGLYTLHREQVVAARQPG